MGSGNAIAEAFVRVRPDTKGFEGQAKSSLFGSAKRIVGGLAAIFAARKVFDFTKEVIADAAQVQKYSETVNQEFGKSAKSIQDFAEGSAAKLGISRQAALSSAASYGILFKNLGIGQQTGAHMTLQIEKLAGAMGQLKGQDPSEALDALRLSLAGNTRGLKQFGIVADSATIKQQAMKMGLISTTKDAITPAIKAQAIYGIAVKHLGEFQDQAKKHSGDLLNVQHELSAEWTNFKEEIGAALLPAVTKLFGFLITIGIPALSLMGGAVRELASWIGSKLSGPFNSLVKAITPVFVNLQELASTFSLMRGAGLGFTTALTLMSEDGLQRLGVSAGTASAIVNTLISTFDVFKTVLSDTASLLGSIVGFFQSSGTAMTILLAVVGGLTSAFIAYRVATAIATAVQAVWTAVLDANVAAQLALNAAMLANPIGLVVLAVAALVGALVVLYVRNETVHKAIDAAWAGIRQAVSVSVAAIRGWITSAIAFLQRFWHEHQTLRTVVFSVWAAIKSFVGGQVQAMKDIALAVMAIFQGRWGDAWHQISKVPGDLLRGAIGVVRNLAHAFGSAAVSIGEAIIHGIEHGIESLASSLAGTLRDKVTGALGGLGSALGIGSPSKYTRDKIGVPIMEGIAAGITRHAPVVEALARGLAPALAGVPATGRTGGGGGAPVLAGATGATVNFNAPVTIETPDARGLLAQLDETARRVAPR